MKYGSDIWFNWLKVNKEELNQILSKSKTCLISHQSETEYNFRNRINPPEAFYIFDLKKKYKALLARFDRTKDNSQDALYTVFSNIEK